MAELTSNEGKNLTIEVDGVTYSRLPLHTHVVTEEDDICDVAETYATPFLRPGDTLFKIGRASCRERVFRAV